jgi:hypothetical protein
MKLLLIASMIFAAAPAFAPALAVAKEGTRKVASDVPSYHMGFNCGASKVFFPDTIAENNVDNLKPNTLGFYTLDLTFANKGLPLESIKLSPTADKKGVIVNQYTRGLPPTTIPIKGGTVDFDHRFAEGLTCLPYGQDMAEEATN